MKATILWDFNGTLLNDMQVCIDCMNSMLRDRNLPFLDIGRYRQIFTFPVREYYQALGFDFTREPFDVPAHQFIDLYRQQLHHAPLHIEAEPLLSHYHAMGYRQIVLSAMEQNLLEETLESKGIIHYFDHVSGIANHLGDGKLEMARELLERHSEVRSSYILVGDTVHDYDVARALDIRCILIARGHQSYERLKSLDCKVLKDFDELKNEIP